MYCVYVSDLTDIKTPLLNVEIEILHEDSPNVWLFVNPHIREVCSSPFIFVYLHEKIKQLSTIIIHNKYDITCCRFGKNRRKNVMIKLPFTFTKYII